MYLPSGMVFMHRSAFFKLGGWPEFAGWGGEDDAMDHKIKLLCTSSMLPNDAIHISHPRSVNDGTSEHGMYVKNCKVMKKIQDMDKEMLLEHIASVLSTIGLRNKYEATL